MQSHVSPGFDYLLLAIADMGPVYGLLQTLLWVSPSLCPCPLCSLCSLFTFAPCMHSLPAAAAVASLSSPRPPSQMFLPKQMPQRTASVPCASPSRRRQCCQTLCFLPEFRTLSQKTRWDQQNLTSPIPTDSPTPAHCIFQPQAFCLTPVLPVHSVFPGQS